MGAAPRPQLDPAAQQVLDLWETIAKRQLNEKQRQAFAKHPALPIIVRSLLRTGPQHLERIGQECKAEGTLRLASWSNALVGWAHRRHTDLEETAKAIDAIRDRSEQIARGYPGEDFTRDVPELEDVSEYDTWIDYDPEDS